MEVVKENNENKITSEQLETIQKQQKDMQSLLVNIGILESQKHGALHSLEALNKEVEAFKTQLEAQYGPININVADGTYSAIAVPEA
jgi:uncharacterized protein (DUF3084 family)